MYSRARKPVAFAVDRECPPRLPLISSPSKPRAYSFQGKSHLWTIQSPVRSLNEVIDCEFLEGGVTNVQLPLLPIAPSTPYLLFQMGLLVGS